MASDPALRDRIEQVVNQQPVIVTRTLREQKAIFGMQDVSNSKFNRALNGLYARHKLWVFRLDQRGDRGHRDYRPCVVTLFRPDPNWLFELERGLLDSYLSA